MRPGVVLNRACIKGFFCPKLGQVSNPQRLTYYKTIITHLLFEYPPPPLGETKLTPFWKPRSPWEEERPLEQERSHDCDKSWTESDNNKISEALHAEQSIAAVHRRQRNNNWTRQKKQGVICFYCLGELFRHFVFEHALIWKCSWIQCNFIDRIVQVSVCISGFVVVSGWFFAVKSE